MEKTLELSSAVLLTSSQNGTFVIIAAWYYTGQMTLLSADQQCQRTEWSTSQACK